MIKSRKELAIALAGNDKVEENKVSKKLSKVVKLWISKNEIKKENGYLIGNF